MIKYELTADMTENRQYWKMMVKTWPTKKWRWSLKVREKNRVKDRSGAHVCLILIAIPYFLLGPETVVGTCLPRSVTSSNVETFKN